jgi:16S rRNA (uracil1498-N3)-methyltransferase
MRRTRLYFGGPIVLGHKVMLDADASGHLLRVLRLKQGDGLKVFDGKGNEFLAEIVAVEKKNAVILPTERIDALPESPLFIHLGQSISRGDKMDYSLQKSVELGVQKITPLMTERGGVKLAKDRMEKKILHWQKVIVSAAEQCGRSFLPTLMPVQFLSSWLETSEEKLRFVLAPSATGRLKNVTYNDEQIALLIGPEGGLSDQEIALAKQHAFQPLQLGPRILRTETAAPTAIAALQCLWGDLG